MSFKFPAIFFYKIYDWSVMQEMFERIDGRFPLLFGFE